jgi:transcriptional regulator with XRE-family HTH domain
MTIRKEMHIVTSSLAMKLRVLRAERRLSLREASRKTGVDKVSLSRFERGLAHPQDRTLGKIAAGYGVPVEELLEIEEPRAPLPGKAEAPRGTGRTEPPKSDYPVDPDPLIPPFVFLPSTEESEVVEIRLSRGDLMETLRRLKAGELSVQEAAVVLEKMPVRQWGRIGPERRSG